MLRERAYRAARMFGRRPIRYLASGERIDLDVRKHWSALANPAFQTIGVIIAALLLGSIISPNNGSDLFDDFVSVVVVFYILRFGFYVWLWVANRIVVTNQRVIEEKGVISRRIASMPLSKVTDLEYHRPLMGRIFGYGELSLESAGQLQAITSIDHLAKPDEFYRQFTTLLARLQGPAGGPPTPAPYEQGEEEEEEARDEDDTGPIPRVIV
jgi:membrane protein YdbS with pleckstrin-like domain